MKFHDTAERRLLTILHCDMVDSTMLVERLDAEEFLELMEIFLNGCQSIVENASGSVAAFTGDGFEAYFGYPVLSDSPAVDALTAAIHIRDAVNSNNFGLSHPIECRIGVATGTVVVGEPKLDAMGRKLTAFGPTTHLAARLQTAAPHNQIFVDEETCTLSGFNNIFKAQGELRLKGFEKPVKAFQLISSPAIQPRFDYSATPMSPFLGRSKSMGILEAKWDLVEKSLGQAICISGDAGMGKSRSILEFEQTLKERGAQVYRFQCSSQHRSTPLHPWVHNMSMMANFFPDDNNNTKREKLRSSLEDHLALGREDQLLCEALLGIADSEEGVTSDSLATHRIESLQVNLVNALLAKSSDASVLIVVEDIQWIDETSKYGLNAMISQCVDKKVCICLTTRDQHTTFDVKESITAIKLKKLSKQSVVSLIEQLIKVKKVNISESVVERIFLKSEGNPLYVEELTSMLTDQASTGASALASNPNKGEETQESASAPVLHSFSHSSIPLILQASLLSKIDRIKQGKPIAQIASVAEENVSTELIKEVSLLSSEEIEAGFAALLDSNIMYRVYRNGVQTYEFRHALLKDAIYASLLNDRRKGLHVLIAQSLKLKLEHDSTVRPELIAHHFDLSGDWANAFGFWVTAAERALRTGASFEALNLLASAQKHQADAKKSDEHAHELQRMHMACGRALNATRGVAADPYKHFVAAGEIGERLDDTPLTVAALSWQFGIDFNAARLSEAKYAASKLRSIAHISDSSIAFVAGSQSLGMVNFMQGQFNDAEMVFETVLEQQSDVVSGTHCFPSMALSYLAWTQFILGKPDQAIISADKAINSAYSESSHAIATALSNCAYVYQCLGEMEKMQQCVNDLMIHCEENGELMYLCRGKILNSWLQARQKNNLSVLSEINHNIDMLMEAKEEVELTYLYGLLADLQLFFNDTSAAFETLSKALALADKNGELFYYAELERMMALLRFQHSEPIDVGEGPSWQCAIDTANGQGAKAWENKAYESQRNFEQAHGS